MPCNWLRVSSAGGLEDADLTDRSSRPPSSAVSVAGRFPLAHMSPDMLIRLPPLFRNAEAGILFSFSSSGESGTSLRTLLVLNVERRIRRGLIGRSGSRHLSPEVYEEPYLVPQNKFGHDLHSWSFDSA
ncbi:hypothetical protein BN2476_670001 [Paraburkholderia piptadeniae]|uniref:Uncharacterized protein n=1 Tax=Paraburkholderia piptadeniae TaxID=1701573 RepID=A0A1N7SNK8_9BURK|nr:hypothetical protein BN2476_670001 [Paraburkholderia piptadeniae]